MSTAPSKHPTRQNAFPMSRPTLTALLFTSLLAACGSPQGPSVTGRVQPNVAAEAKVMRAPASMPVMAMSSAVKFGRTSASSPAMQIQPSDTAKYDKITDNAINLASEQPVSTFSLDVDTGSYANTRRFLTEDRMPPPDAVRVEELLNYFPAESQNSHRLDNAPFAVDYELTQAPWAANKTLMRVNVQAMDIQPRSAPAAHLTFLVDVSGSMQDPKKLPLVKKSLKILVDNLRPQDTVSLVTYADGTRVVLQPTSGSKKSIITAAIDELQAGGGTAGASGLQLGYDMARKNFVKGDVNRVLLATDGDFNLGVSSTEELKAFIKRERDSGITLSTLGFGSNNFNDAMMEQIANVGNGNFSYIDSSREAMKVLSDEMGSTLLTVAKDVKAQIEFNPTRVQEWRQIGYENRQLKREDFNNDAVDAGDIGAGKRVTVLYELLLQGEKASVDPLRYQHDKGLPVPPALDSRMGELAFVKLRWKAPSSDKSQMVSVPVTANKAVQAFDRANVDTRFMGAVAAFGQKLRNNPAVASTSWDNIATWANAAKGADDKGYRSEFVQLVLDAKRLSKP